MGHGTLPKWKDKCKLDKALYILQCIIVIAFLTPFTLNDIGVTGLEGVGNICIPLIILMFLTMGLQYRKQNKEMMFTLFGGAVVLLVYALMGYFHIY